MPAREINPFTALTRIRSQLMRSFCVRMNGLDSSHTILMKFNVDNVVDLLE